jgi:hypothetical protein
MTVGKCPVCGHDEVIGTRTNAEYIRELTDEEMAEWFDEHCCDAMWCTVPPKEDCPPHKECVKCILEWLREEKTDA